MTGISDGRNVDDVLLHLSTILDADTKRRAVPDGETAEALKWRVAPLLTPALRARVESALGDLSAQSPSLSAAETAKLLDSRAGRDALTDGRDALGRVDDHLQEISEERDPAIGAAYGVKGENPQTFGGVFRALSLSIAEDDRLKALPAADAAREYVFSDAVRGELDRTRAALDAVLVARIGSRAELVRRNAVRAESIAEAAAVISKVRQRLYANLPDRKQDDALRAYGFRLLEPATGPRKKGDPVAPPAAGGPPVAT